MFPELSFDPRTFSGDALTNLRKLALETITETAPTFGEWLRKWVETEQYWRATDADHRPAKHFIALPPAVDWTNKELADALRAVTILSYIESDEAVGAFVDRIIFSITEAAADRLIKNG